MIRTDRSAGGTGGSRGRDDRHLAGAFVLSSFGLLGRAARTAGEAPDRSRRPRWLGIDVIPALDGVLMLILFGVGYGQFDAANRKLPDHLYANFALLFLVAMLTVPLLLRDRMPGLAWSLSVMSNLWTIGVARTLLSAPFLSAGVIVLLYCLYTVAVRYDRRATTVAWALCTALGIAFTPHNLFWVAILVAVPVLLGLNVRARRAAQDELAEQEHRHQEERAVLEERQRIARELHDVVAHHMSVIAIHAEAAPYKVAHPPEELAESFADIRSSALEGLTELRRILGVLRTEHDPQTVPQPGLDRLDEIVASARNGGLQVEAAVTGEPPMLSQGIGLSAYRILQEALSNAMKHAHGASVRVGIAYEPGSLRLHVVNGLGDTAAPLAATGGGHGLVGMHERVAMLGGELIAEPTPDGGFAVTAVLPLTDAVPG